MKVFELMSPAIVAVHPKTPVRSILEIMLRRHLNDVLVMDVGRRLVGIVTYSDLSRKLLPTEVELVEHEEYLVRPECMEERIDDITNVPVCEVMTTHVITVPLEAEVLKAGAMMTAHHVKQLPVVRGEEVVGIISHADIGWGLMMRYGRRSEVHEPLFC